MTAQRIEAVLRPASVALVRACATPGSLRAVLCLSLREGGFRAPRVYLNARRESIAGLPAYPVVRSLPHPRAFALPAPVPPRRRAA